MSNNGKIAAAIAMARRQSIYGPADQAFIVGAADLLEARGEPFSRDETRVLDRADRLRHREPAPAPAPKIHAGYDRDVAARAAEVAGERLLFQPAEDAWLLASAALRTAELRGEGSGKREKLAGAMRAAEENYKLRRAALELALGRLSDAQQARQNAVAVAQA
jgi:hypothetical protein